MGGRPIRTCAPGANDQALEGQGGESFFCDTKEEGTSLGFPNEPESSPLHQFRCILRPIPFTIIRFEHYFVVVSPKMVRIITMSLPLAVVAAVSPFSRSSLSSRLPDSPTDCVGQFVSQILTRLLTQRLET